MECKDCEYAVYDDFDASYRCHKDPDNKELKFYPKRNAPKCDRKILNQDLIGGGNNMASVEELKKMIVELKMDLVRANIPKGNCPYAYYSTSKKKDREYCDDIDCSECMRNFLRDKKNDIREEISKL